MFLVRKRVRKGCGMSNLTARKVAALSEAGKYRDGPDLYLIGKGAKSWAFRYKARGRTGEMELCSADLFSLAAARRKALDLRCALREGREVDIVGSEDAVVADRGSQAKARP